MLDTTTPKSSGRTSSTTSLPPLLMPSQPFSIDDVNNIEQRQYQQEQHSTMDLTTPKSSGRTPSTIPLSPLLLPSQSSFVDDVNNVEQQQQQQQQQQQEFPSQRSLNGDGIRSAPKTMSSSSSKIINSPG